MAGLFAGQRGGAVVRHAAGTIVATVGALLLLPSLFWGETYRWVKEIGNTMPPVAAVVAVTAVHRRDL